MRAGPFSAEQRAWWTAAANAACGAGFGYGVLWLVGKIGSLMFRKEAMGGGDIKLFAAIGAFLGIVNCLYVLFLSSLLGASFGIASLIASRWRGGAGRASEEMGEADAESLTARAMEYIYPDETPTDDSGRTRDRAALLNLLTQPPPSRTMRRHLPFGPYLAMASFLVMLYQPYFDAFVQRYLGLFGAL
ncbi:MAG: Type IV leader peptidase family protein [candidate division BRC1 bacterium ADurb.BinA364]|nr:MAG: Type IV leader peptidase family protein [candidate division BRC1 bacterium ADurb.BinA364]